MDGAIGITSMDSYLESRGVHPLETWRQIPPSPWHSFLLPYPPLKWGSGVLSQDNVCNPTLP